MKNSNFLKAFKAFAPVALGAIGSYVAFVYPLGFSAFCGGL